MTEVLVLFPHQLFRSNLALARAKTVLLVEDALYFIQYSFHKQKLVLHRASMQVHAQLFREAGVPVVYLEAAQAPNMAAVFERLRKLDTHRLHYIDPVDDWLERRLLREASKSGMTAQRHDTPMFLTSMTELTEAFRGKRMSMASFYVQQLKRLGVLLDGTRPLGGRWSYDLENRKRLPRGLHPPERWRPPINDHVREACDYVERNFAGHPGNTADFSYPVSYADATAALRDFTRNRLQQFGPFEDAIAADEPTVFHSVLTPMLNIGLLTPLEVLDHVLGADAIPLSSLEGFVRQLIGWREFMRASYVLHGRQQRTRNFWRHERNMPASFWRGTTGIEPVDIVIGRVLRHAYTHHIERLMVLANFMQLCGFHPDHVYRWFMELFIDAYDWVMVPNVYGMALHADGGLITTKPYISGSSYLRKMSNFPRGAWCDTWDGLFWSFVDRHRDYFASNPRTALLARQLERISNDQLYGHRARAERFQSTFVNPIARS
jgi:deoxyribodipyrimidine photolyase-related protein